MYKLHKGLSIPSFLQTDIMTATWEVITQAKQTFKHPAPGNKLYASYHLKHAIELDKMILSLL